MMLSIDQRSIRRMSAWGWWFALFPALLACERDVDTSDWKGAPPRFAEETQGAPQATSPDRLPPGDLLEGTERTFGFSVPKGMTLIQSARGSVMRGPVNFDELTSYVQARIAVRHAEMEGDTLFFRSALIRDGEKGIFEFSISTERRDTILRIKNRTPNPPVFGLSEKERWKRAGMKPSGGLIDPHQMQ